MERLFGSILLVSGCLIGAGMLGLPVMTAQIGFLPTVVSLFLALCYMIVTGLLLVEVNLCFPQANLISMVDNTLGKMGVSLTWVLFLVLFYSLMVAYSIGSGQIIQDLTGIYVSYGTISMGLLCGVFIYFGTYFVDELNRLMMLGLVVSYFILLVVGGKEVKVEQLVQGNFSKSLILAPSLLVLFGYQNLIPTLSSYLNYDRKKLILMPIFGCLFAFIFYVLWEGLILGLISTNVNTSLAQDKGALATYLLKEASEMPWVIEVAHAFSFFAIITSFLGVGLSFADFLADGFKIRNRFFVSLLCLAPALITSFLAPMVFIKALKYASFITIALFGLLPLAMVYVCRYRLHFKNDIIGGGKFGLFLLMIISLSMMGILFFEQIGWIRC